MSIADAEKIEKEIKERDKESAAETKAIDEEKDPQKKAKKQKDHEDSDAITAGMREVARALRENPNARPGAVIPRLVRGEQGEVKDLREQRDAAAGRHDQGAVNRLDRAIELAEWTIRGKEKANELLALAPGARHEEGQFAMKLSIEDDAGRQVVQLTINLFSGMEYAPQPIAVRESATATATAMPVRPADMPAIRSQG
jgi:hypothetical protein